jgi:hypothetical protein
MPFGMIRQFMTKRQRKEKAVELAGSIIALTLGLDVEMTIIVRDSHSGEVDGDMMIRSTLDTAADAAQLLYRAADHFATQATAEGNNDNDAPSTSPGRSVR